jgi:hypothetical protein
VTVDRVIGDHVDPARVSVFVERTDGALLAQRARFEGSPVPGSR